MTNILTDIKFPEYIKQIIVLDMIKWQGIEFARSEHKYQQSQIFKLWNRIHQNDLRTMAQDQNTRIDIGGEIEWNSLSSRSLNDSVDEKSDILVKDQDVQNNDNEPRVIELTNLPNESLGGLFGKK